jgi:hypothetical protein
MTSLFNEPVSSKENAGCAGLTVSIVVVIEFESVTLPPLPER